jgi:CheY-like chemotaxis protein
MAWPPFRELLVGARQPLVRRRILVADDNAEIRKTLCHLFADHATLEIPSKLRDLQNEQTEDVNAPYTFTARCRFCEYESVHAVRDIRKFGGKPRNRKS